MAALEARGELDDTVIVWTADHGSLLGDHDIIHKSVALERSAHVPFFVRCPDSVPAGSQPNGFSGHVDLFPTLMGLAGAQTPSVCEGKDVWPMISGQTDRVQDEAFIEIRNDASIVTDGWKMTVQIAPWNPSDRPMMGGELYDRTADPDELTNVFDDPAYAEVQASLRKRLVAFDPRLDSLLASGTTLDPLPQPAVYTFSQGEVCDRGSVRQPPHQPKRNMSVEVVLPAVRPAMSGVLFAAGSYRYGYTLRLDGGKLTFATQRWEHDPVVLEAPLAPSDAPVTISASHI